MKRILLTAVIVALSASPAYSQNNKKHKTAAFDARHELKIMVPAGAKKIRAWFALPQGGGHEIVGDLKIDSPVPYRIERERTEGSKFLYVEAEASTLKNKELTVVLTPRQDAGPVNAIPKAYVEIDGKIAREGPSADWTRKLTFKEVTPLAAGGKR